MPGITEAVVLRVIRVIGSRIISVRLPRAAPTTTITRRKYLIRRRRDGSRFWRRRAFLNRTYSSTVPMGQNQPHQTRPSTTVAPRVISASERCQSH